MHILTMVIAVYTVPLIGFVFVFVAFFLYYLRTVVWEKTQFLKITEQCVISVILYLACGPILLGKYFYYAKEMVVHLSNWKVFLK